MLISSTKGMFGRPVCFFPLVRVFFYYPPLPSDDQQIRDKLAELATIHSLWGFWMMHYHLWHLNYTYTAQADISDHPGPLINHQFKLIIIRHKKWPI